MRMTPAVILVGVLALLASIALIMVYWPYVQQDTTPSEIFRGRTAEEAAGGRSTSRTAAFTAIPSRFGPSTGTSVGTHRPGRRLRGDEPIQLGSQRTGVDLSQEGGEHPDDWHHAHFVNPRYTRPSSIMPPFEWLGMERIHTLTQYVQGLGLKMADTRIERQRHWKQESIKAYEAGPDVNVRWLAEQIPEGGGTSPTPIRPRRPACSAVIKFTSILHRLPRPDRRRHGPGQPWIYPPPLNFTILKGGRFPAGSCITSS